MKTTADKLQKRWRSLQQHACPALDDHMHELHPFASSWRVNLMNDAIEECYIERVFEDDDYRLRLGKRMDGWMNVKGATDPVYLEGEDVVVWTMNDREELDELIAMLIKLRGSVQPRQNAGAVAPPQAE
jgi:hypothetical protein